MRKNIFLSAMLLFICAACVQTRNIKSRNTLIISNDVEGVVINGVRWATRNVDAPGTFAANPESAGKLYEWNNKTDGRFISGSFEKILERQDFIFSITSWTNESNPCPEGWRVPTKSELQSLIDAGSVWTRRNRVNGRLFGTAPNQIFLPAVFECNIDIPVLVGAPQPTVNRNIACGNYWSSEASDTGLWFLNFDKNYAHIGEWGYYQNSRGVRCVTE